MTEAQLIEQLRERDAELAQLQAANAELAETVRKLTGQLEWCKRQLFGRKSERFEDPNQPNLFPDAPGSAQQETPGTITVQRRVSDRRGKREPIPDDLRRELIIHQLPEDQLVDPATGEQWLEKLGEEVSEKLAFRPGEVYVERHVRITYRRVNHENLDGAQPQIVTAPALDEGLAKCLAAPSLLAEIAVRKYADHLPLDRLVKIFKRHGVSLSKASMCRWMQGVGELAQPLLALMKARMIGHSRVIQHDDTPVCQQEPGGGRTRTCRFWTVVGQPGTAGHYVLFDYTQSRQRAGPEAWFLDDAGQALFVGGQLQCDAFAGYNGLLDPAGPWQMIHIGCFAHARRKFHDVRTSAPAQACQAMGLIRQLYEIESRIKDESETVRVEVRQAEAKPLVDTFFQWCREQQKGSLPKSGIGEAFSYALNQEVSLRRYLEAGHLQIDNNACERSLRGIAIGRRNWLFTGSPAGGKAAAQLFSLIASARLHDVEPLAYLQDIIRRLPATPIRQLDQYLPDVWEPSMARR